MKRLLTYGWLLLTLLASLFVMSACQKEEVSKNEVMLTFNTRSDVADAKSDATTDVESMQELRVIMVNQDGTIIGNQKKTIATDQTQETFNFQAPVKNGNESFTFFAIANESSIVPDNLRWIEQPTGTLFANSINEYKTTQIGNDAVFDFSKHIPQTKIWEVSYSEIKESGGNLSITKQLEYVTGKISVHFVNQTNEQQSLSNIHITGITPNTQGYLFKQDGTDYIDSKLTDNGNAVSTISFGDLTLDAPTTGVDDETIYASDSVAYYTYPLAEGNFNSPMLYATWGDETESRTLALSGITSLKRNDHLKIIVTLTGQELVVNYSIAPWVEKLTYIGSPTIGGGYNTEDWTAGGDVNIGGDPVVPGDVIWEGTQEIDWGKNGGIHFTMGADKFKACYGKLIGFDFVITEGKNNHQGFAKVFDTGGAEQEYVGIPSTVQDGKITMEMDLSQKNLPEGCHLFISGDGITLKKIYIKQQ